MSGAELDFVLPRLLAIGQVNLAVKTVQEVCERSYTGMATRKVARCTAPTALEVDTCPAVQLLMTKPSLAFCNFILL